MNRQEIRFCVDDVVDAPEEVVVDLFLAEVHSTRRVEAGEGCEAGVGVCDVPTFFPSPSRHSLMAYCTECGTWLDPAKGFCPQCGREITQPDSSSGNFPARAHPHAGNARIHRISGSTKYLLRGMREINGKKISTLDEMHHLHAHHEAILSESKEALTRKFIERGAWLNQEEQRLSRDLREGIERRTLEVDREIGELREKAQSSQGFFTRVKYHFHAGIAGIFRNGRIHRPFSTMEHELGIVRYDKDHHQNHMTVTIERESRNITASYEYLKDNESFLIGADGEEYVIGVLSGLPEGYHVINDVNLHFSKAIHWRERDEWIKNSQIDHIVVGPTGVFLLETKNWKSSDMETKSDKLRYQVRRSSLALWYYLKDNYWGRKQPRVQSVIVSMKGNPTGRKPDKFIDIVTPRRLCPYITEREVVLSGEEIDKLVRLLAR